MLKHFINFYNEFFEEKRKPIPLLFKGRVHFSAQLFVHLEHQYDFLHHSKHTLNLLDSLLSISIDLKRGKFGKCFDLNFRGAFPGFY